MRWRIKYVILGLAVIFGAHVYVRSQAILFSVQDMALSSVESSALLIGLPLPGGGVRAHRPGRDRRLPFPGRPALVADGPHRRRLPLHRRRAGGDCPPRRRRGELPVPGPRGADGHGGPGGAAAVGPPPAARAAVRRPPLRAVPARLGAHLDASSRIGWPTCATRRDLCTASARSVSETFDVLSVTVWLLDERQGAARGRRLDRATTDAGALAGGGRGHGLERRLGWTAREDVAVRPGRGARGVGGGAAATQPVGLRQRRPPLVRAPAGRGHARSAPSCWPTA